MTDLTKEQITFTAGQETIFLHNLNFAAGQGTYVCEQITFVYQTDIPKGLKRTIILIRDKV